MSERDLLGITEETQQSDAVIDKKPVGPPSEPLVGGKVIFISPPNEVPPSPQDSSEASYPSDNSLIGRKALYADPQGTRGWRDDRRTRLARRIGTPGYKLAIGKK